MLPLPLASIPAQNTRADISIDSLEPPEEGFEEVVAALERDAKEADRDNVLLGGELLAPTDDDPSRAHLGTAIELTERVVAWSDQEASEPIVSEQGAEVDDSQDAVAGSVTLDEHEIDPNNEIGREVTKSAVPDSHNSKVSLAAEYQDNTSAGSKPQTTQAPTYTDQPNALPITSPELRDGEDMVQKLSQSSEESVSTKHRDVESGHRQAAESEAPTKGSLSGPVDASKEGSVPNLVSNAQVNAEIGLERPALSDAEVGPNKVAATLSAAQHLVSAEAQKTKPQSSASPVQEFSESSDSASESSQQARSVAVSNTTEQTIDVTQQVKVLHAQVSGELIILADLQSPLPDARSDSMFSGESRVIEASTRAAQSAPIQELPRPAVLQIVEALRPGTGTIDVTLSPEELGRVTLSLGTHDGHLTVLVQAERPETAEAIRRSLDLLLAEANAAGFENVSLDFATGGGNSHESHSESEEAPSSQSWAVELTDMNTPRVSETTLDLRL